MDHPLRCRCGIMQGYVDAHESAGRAVCYCKSCQAFARFLEQEADILNSNGGTEIIACLPRSVHFTTGVDKLACMSLSEQGLLRWYSSCCRTPIGNTPRDRKMPYVGLVRACLPGSDASFDQAFGPLKVSLNTESALGKVKPTLAPTLIAVAKIMKKVISARLSGKYRDNPFFKPNSDTPIEEPRVLTQTERRALEEK